MDIEILKSIAAASGRETFITNSGFGLLWSNSQRDLLELISIGGCTDMLRRTDHETVIRCEDQALHIIPVIMDGERIYFFELVAPAFAAELFRKTAAFDAMYARLRGTIDGYSSELSPIALQDPSCAARMNRPTDTESLYDNDSCGQQMVGSSCEDHISQNDLFSAVLVVVH